jgi:Zn-dependent protease
MSEQSGELRHKVAAGHAPPPDLDFHLPPLETPADQPDFYVPEFDSPAPPAEPKPSKLKQLEARGGILGTIATAVILLLKVAAPVLKVAPFLPKLLVTGGSMLLSIWLEALVFGWAFAVGIVLLIFIHECGHAFAARQRGLAFSFMLFIPFMGAMVAHKRGGRNVVEDAYIGIMGPVFGTLAGFACLGVYAVTGGRFWIAMAHVNFMLNLFNLLPMAPLDGGWITPVFSPKLLAAGIVLLVFVAPSNPIIWVLAILSLPRIIGHWKGHPEDPYFRVTSAVRWRYAIAYLGLVGILGYTSLATDRAIRPRRLGSVDIATEHSRPGAASGEQALTR